jgi:hypothetical protein
MAVTNDCCCKIAVSPTTGELRGKHHSTFSCPSSHMWTWIRQEPSGIFFITLR